MRARLTLRLPGVGLNQMADPKYLDEFIENQQSGLHRRLLQGFRAKARKGGVSENECAVVLRQMMDKLLMEAARPKAAHATDQSTGK